MPVVVLPRPGASRKPERHGPRPEAHGNHHHGGGKAIYMPARNRTRTFVTRKTSSSHLAEIRRRVAKRGGTRHVQHGALKLQMPRAYGTDELVP